MLFNPVTRQHVMKSYPATYIERLDRISNIPSNLFICMKSINENNIKTIIISCEESI